MLSPWGKIVAPESVNLQDIMAEELAKHLRVNEKRKNVPTDYFEIFPHFLEEEVLLKSDDEIAKLLQQQFDEHHKDILQYSEDEFNDFDSDTEDQELEDIYKKDRNSFYAGLACRTLEEGGRKSECKAMSFSPEFDTSNSSCNIRISNKLLNSSSSLKLHDKHKQYKKRYSIDNNYKKDNVVYAKTRSLLYKLTNKQLQVSDVISIGKEAIIFHAERNPKYPKYPKYIFPNECAIKVFKTTASDSNHRDKYIKDDYRFRDRNGKLNNGKIIRFWAENEMRNLQKLKRSGIPCPEPITLKGHILITSFIGTNNKPAPMLKYANLSDVKQMIAYEQIVQHMKTLYTECNLIHADLSEYNVLWYNNNSYIIDLSQSVERSHQNAYEFLYRDCNCISQFFKKQLPNIPSSGELFKDITECDYNDKSALLALQESIKIKTHCTYR